MRPTELRRMNGPLDDIPSHTVVSIVTVMDGKALVRYRGVNYCCDCDGRGYLPRESPYIKPEKCDHCRGTGYRADEQVIAEVDAELLRQKSSVETPEQLMDKAERQGKFGSVWAKGVR